MKECTGKKYCDCAREAMDRGANRDWVDGTEETCPFRTITPKLGDKYAENFEQHVKEIVSNTKPESVPSPKGEQETRDNPIIELGQNVYG